MSTCFCQCVHEMKYDTMNWIYFVMARRLCVSVGGQCESLATCKLCVCKVNIEM